MGQKDEVISSEERQRDNVPNSLTRPQAHLEDVFYKPRQLGHL